MDEQKVFRAFGRVLREARRERGVSQERLALECGCDRTFVSRLERGLTQPSLVSLLRVAEALDMKASTLVERVESAKLR